MSSSYKSFIMAFMRLHRFFIEQEIPDSEEVTIADKDLIHQWQKVFRLKTGDKVIIFDGSGFDYVSEFVSLDRNNSILKIVEKKLNQNIQKKEIHLFQSIIKKDKFEWVLEKGTELGVSFFHPIISERSEKKNINFERANKIIKEASEQSGRLNLPHLNELANFEDVLGNIGFTQLDAVRGASEKRPSHTSEYGEGASERRNEEMRQVRKSYNDFVSIAFDPTGDKFDKNDFEKEKILGIFIGPEGGWSDRELELFKEKRFKILSLGNQILKAETAAIAVSSLLLL